MPPEPQWAQRPQPQWNNQQWANRQPPMPQQPYAPNDYGNAAPGGYPPPWYNRGPRW
jgi:hypothetical protein